MTKLVVAYTALRLSLFTIAFLLLLILTPIAGIIAVAIALLVSAVASYPLGRHQRDRMTALLLERRAAKTVSR